ncbi:MAG: VWA domain-containing protein, partial [Tidjanibacter sp.]|nr:VWA domain-containing protein [Tidjanibacter sp.]
MYDAPITRSQKGAFMLLLDQSGSMAEKITYQGELLTKAQALCYAVSEILEELISYSYRGFFVGDYFDV